MNNKSLPLPNPDFDGIKDSLKEFMRNYDGLTDYDFDGSTISIMLDTLAYNSHLNAFWLNMIGNESTLHTAIKRNNVVAAAMDLGYTPNSAKSAYTDLYVEYSADGDVSDTITIPAGSTFSASSESTSYTFNVLDDNTAAYDINKGAYVIDNLRIKEGRLLIHEWEVVTNHVLGVPDKVKDVVHEGITIPNLNVDDSSILVYVKNSVNDWVLYNRFDNSSLNVNKNSLIYFINENENGLLNITFGDGNIGKKPGVGSKLKVIYLVSSGPGANSIVNFNSNSAISGGKINKVIAKYPTAGGAFTESTNSIKYNAQISYESQGRGVLASDYEFLVRQVYPNAKKVIVWGGQDNNPPQYGKVFMSIQPQDGLVLIEKEISEILKYISSKNVMTISPVIVNPDYTFIDVSTKVKYNAIGASTTNGQLETNIANAIRKFSVDSLNSYQKDLEYSRLLTAIDASAPSVISNTTNLRLTKRLYINNDKGLSTTLNYSNKLKVGSIVSSPFKYSTYDSCTIEAVDSKLHIVTNIISEGVSKKITLYTDIGTVDYEKGIIIIKLLKGIPKDIFFDSTKNQYYIKLYAESVTNNIISKHNQILNIENISVISERVN